MIRVIRNDDVCADTTLHEIRTFCELCDRYSVTPLHAITPIGTVRPIQASMDNAIIRRVSGTALFSENREVVEYLESRFDDKFAVHGLWHTHAPTLSEIRAADELIYEADLLTGYFVPPFNEGTYNTVLGVDDSLLTVCGAGIPRLEEYLEAGDPNAEIVYLHSWRLEYGPFSWQALDRCLKRLTGAA